MIVSEWRTWSRDESPRRSDAFAPPTMVSFRRCLSDTLSLPAQTIDNQRQSMTVNDRAPRVLVVDDDESVRTFTDRVLGDAGYEVVVASDGPAALRIAEQQGPSEQFVVGVMMPQMSGDELARQLRRADPDVKVLYFTGYSDRLFKEKPTLWAYEAFVDKPVNMTGLLEAVSLLRFGHTHGPR